MNTKTDLRVVKTRTNIKNAFIDLLLEKDFHEITIQNILDNALINRSTFYNHYIDKFDLAEQLINEIVDYVAALIDERFSPSKHTDFIPTISKVYDYLYTHKKTVLALCKIQTDSLHLYEDLDNLLKEKCLTYLLHAYPSKNHTLLDYYSAIYTGIVLSSIKWLLTCGKRSDIVTILAETEKLLKINKHHINSCSTNNG